MLAINYIHYSVGVTTRHVIIIGGQRTVDMGRNKVGVPDWTFSGAAFAAMCKKFKNSVSIFT